MIRCGQTDTIKTLSTVTAKNVIVWLLQRRAEEGAVSFFKGPLENSIHSCPMDLQKEREPSIEICARWLHRGLCLLGVGYSEPRTALTVTLGNVVSNDTLIRSYFSFSFWQWCLRERAQIKKKKMWDRKNAAWGNMASCFQMPKHKSNTFLWFVLLKRVLSLAEPEFRTKWITHLHAVIPGACWWGYVYLVGDFFFSQIQRHLLSWGSLSIKNQIGC